jgi:hypothetical protein
MDAGAAPSNRMTQDPNALISIAAAAAAALIMIQSGYAKGMLEERRKRRQCPSCGRVNSCSCG